MTSLIDDAPEGVNTPEFTVSELSGAVKRTVEGAFSHVRVRGELGRVSRPRSGHVYLDLKDDRAVLAGVIWKGVAGRLTHPPEEGMEVIATGRLTTFPGQSKYQIVIEDLLPAGAGALMAMLEKRRKALAGEGLFDAARKQALPFLPRTIGVVTSPSGAVIRDILHRLAERFPVRVLVWPVAVQGERCAPEVAAAIAGFNALGGADRPDVVIVARGGGSVEDLWGFNDEAVVRAVADSRIPLISAVGHETDTTLIDHAADRRAPTPTAAAEMAVPVRAELAATLADLQARRLRALRAGLDARRQRLVDLARALPRPGQILAERRQRLDLAHARMPRAGVLIAPLRQRLDRPAARLAPALRQTIGQARLALARRETGLAPGLRSAVRAARLALGRVPVPAGVLAQRCGHGRERLSGLAGRLPPAMARQMAGSADRLAGVARTLGALGYKATLGRGYAVVRAEGAVAARAGDIAAGAGLEIEFADGRMDATAVGQPKRPRRVRKPGPGGPQGELF